MSERKYTLELSAEELDGLQGSYINDESVVAKLRVLVQQARADRERDDLRLPWEARLTGHSKQGTAVFNVFVSGGGSPYYGCTERAAKLMSAAPELLEAVQALRNRIAMPMDDEAVRARALADRALRKVETGVPE